MEIGAPHPKAGPVGKRSFGGQPGTDKTNSPEPIGVNLGDAHAEPLQSGDAIWHKPFAARLVNRRTATVRDRDFEPALSRRQCRRNSRRTSADHENVYGIVQTRISHHSSATNSEQKPGPMAANSPKVPGLGRRFFITSSSTISTEADDRFPIRRKQSHEAANWPFSSPSAAAVA